MNPKISVLMPVYNGAKYLKEAIDSILAQSFKDFEFLIINDASTDNSAEIIKSYSDNRINFLNNEKNIGLAASLNKGLDIAKGEYIARMDQDDISLPQRLQKQIEFMNKNPEIDICGSWIKFFGEMNFVAKYAQSHKQIVSNMFTSSPFAHPSVIIKKERFDQHNLRYNPDLKTAEDYELWTRASKYLKFANIQEVLLNYRTSPSQMTKSTSALDEANKIIWKTQLKNLGVNFSDKELDIHWLLLTEKYQITDTKEFIINSSNWFDKIIFANKEKQIYDTKTLINLFKHKWYVAFKNSPECCIIELFINQNKYKYLNFKNKFGFLYRFLKKQIRKK
ncbi:MAG TPA: glycosyltransferase [Candidatus Gastranaerophilales bacterium]|nr:glycosyltransferase [Candidatus Gastranaerophilales bacterium]